MPPRAWLLLLMASPWPCLAAIAGSSASAVVQMEKPVILPVVAGLLLAMAPGLVLQTAQVGSSVKAVSLQVPYHRPSQDHQWNPSFVRERWMGQKYSVVGALVFRKLLAVELLAVGQLAVEELGSTKLQQLALATAAQLLGGGAEGRVVTAVRPLVVKPLVVKPLVLVVPLVALNPRVGLLSQQIADVP